MIEVTLQDRQLAYAKRMADKKEALYLNKSNNPTGLTEPDRFFTGIKGELAFLKLMMDNGRKVVWRFHELDEKAPTEFILSKGGKKIYVDVKSSSGFTPEGREHRFMMIPEYSFQSEGDVDYYVGVKFNGSIAEIYGYITRSEMGKIEPCIGIPKVSSHIILLTSLEPIGEFIATLDTGKALMQNVGTMEYKELGQ